MGELRAVFDAMKKERKERRKSLEPNRAQYGIDLLIEAMYAVAWDGREKAIYIYNGNDRKNHIAKLYIILLPFLKQQIRNSSDIKEYIKSVVLGCKYPKLCLCTFKHSHTKYLS